jgi:ubiquinone/menaquinone biosynthesis C-methylase UbiE
MFPSYLKPVSRFFRARRNQALSQMIDQMQLSKGAALEVLDIGGSVVFWISVPDAARSKCNVSLINLPGAYNALPPDEECIKSAFTLLVGDARDLSQFADHAFDLIVCNSVIEHLGSWADMVAAAKEAQRVGRRGWVQVPAFEFPVEQHFLLPFVHWFADPIQIKMLALLHGEFKKRSFYDQHMSVHHVRPLTRGELSRLFPGARIRSEWLIFPKSHLAIW